MIHHPMVQSGRPPALVALDTYPLLRASVEHSLSRQVSRIFERVTTFQGRQTLCTQLEHLAGSLPGGLVTIESPPGGGVTSLLATFVAKHPCAFWFYDEDAGDGATALCAQLIALTNLPVPIPPPAAKHDPHILESFLDQIVTHASPDTPIVLVIDPPTCPAQPRDPFPIVLPPTLPPNVVLLYGCTPDTSLPYKPVARIHLPHTGAEVSQDQMLALRATGCVDEVATAIVSHAAGNFLYLRLAYEMIQAKYIDQHRLPSNLDALYHAWWSHLDTSSQHLALLLASASDPLPVSICAELLQTDPQPILDTWGQMTLIEKHTRTVHHQNDTPSGDQQLTSQTIPSVAYYHWSTRDYFVRHHSDALRQIHTDLVNLARSDSFWGLGTDQNHANQTLRIHQDLPTTDVSREYLSRNLSRHAAFASPQLQDDVLQLCTQRPWIRSQERRNGSLSAAAQDLRWELYSATRIPAYLPSSPTACQPDMLIEYVLRLGRGAIMTGTLMSLTRTMSPDTAVAALEHALEHIGRESGVKRILAVVDQMPDGHAKAHILRQLGETCYQAKLRTSAMRLLSQALDLEEQRVPPAWREQRDQVLNKLVQSALDIGAVDSAQEISEYIEHVERRGMAETLIVRWLLAHGELVRARKIATAISHENLTAWAQAEVVIAFAQVGDMYTAEMLLGDIQIETARAWATIELASLVATHNQEEARERIEQLESPNQRDHGRSRLSEVLAQTGNQHQALDIATHITDIAVRVQALLNLRWHVSEITAVLALKQAESAIAELAEDVRVPLVAMLAASYASLGHRERAFAVAAQLPEGEEYDRARSRIAVALTQHKNFHDGIDVTRSIRDDDERDWTLDEIAQVLAEHGHWQEAQARAHEISDDNNRARTLANLAITLARTGTPLAASQLARTVKNPVERMRALHFLATLLVQAGYRSEALAIYHDEQRKHDEDAPDALEHIQIVRYLTIVAIALAEENNLTQAWDIVTTIPYPFNQARVYITIAQTAASCDCAQAYRALGSALRLGCIDRSHTFKLVEHAIPTFTIMGGAQLLTRLASAIYDSDNWLV